MSDLLYRSPSLVHCPVCGHEQKVDAFYNWAVSHWVQICDQCKVVYKVDVNVRVSYDSPPRIDEPKRGNNG